jgi:hypothetical protein
MTFENFIFQQYFVSLHKEKQIKQKHKPFLPQNYEKNSPLRPGSRGKRGTDGTRRNSLPLDYGG